MHPNSSNLSSADRRDVAVSTGAAMYPPEPPFSPGNSWPEYRPVFGDSGRQPNAVYAAVRNSLRLLGLDRERDGTTKWNPLGACIRPGDTVVVKPNFVRDFRESSRDDADCLVTHGAVLRAVLDFAFLALKGNGRLIVADAPQNDADFEAIRRIVHLDALRDFYARALGFPLEVYDLRQEAATKIDGVIVGHTRLRGDPAGYTTVNLGGLSAFHPVEDLCHRLYGTEYERDELLRHHTTGRHEYLISRTVLQADCVIGIPKLKTHKKTGLTVNLKNLVGINGDKNWLPHHREGTPSAGGDQFADNSLRSSMERLTMAVFKRVFPWMGPVRRLIAQPAKAVGKRVFGDTNAGRVRSGNWHGNDTTWRMVLDLNRILLYADVDGRLHDQPLRSFFGFVDGVVGGEGNGPLDPTPKPSGVVLAGSNPVAIDLAAAQLMGFDYARLPLLRVALERHPLPLVDFGRDDVRVRSNDARYNRPLQDLRGRILAFEPHFGWKGHVEVAESPDGCARA
jgi:uncharacterized protein (DUF362 family)